MERQSKKSNLNSYQESIGRLTLDTLGSSGFGSRHQDERTIAGQKKQAQLSPVGAKTSAGCLSWRERERGYELQNGYFSRHQFLCLALNSYIHVEHGGSDNIDQ